MKILLLGEFSGLFNNLKTGFSKLGHDVTTISSADGWKKIDSDFSWGSKRTGILGKFEESLNLLNIKDKLSGYDVVYIISTTIGPRVPYLNRYVIKYIKENNSRVFLCGAGMNDPFTARFFKEKYKYPEWYAAIKGKHNEHWSLTNSGYKYCLWLFSIIDGYIPIMYEYAQGWRNVGHEKLKSTIPLAVDLNKIEYDENVIKNKLVLFHGLNRPKVKGSEYIVAAMNEFYRKYPNDVEVIVRGNMPLNEYMTIINSANVVLDQCYSCSTGMNGAFSLAKGKVVLGGADSEYLFEHKFESSPIYNIEPSVNQILNTLGEVMDLRHNILQLGRESRDFVRRAYDPIVVAKYYTDVFEC